jgi:hypothetical protein
VRTGVQTRRIGIVAYACRGCGTIGIYWNGRLIRRVSLAASGTTPRRLVTVIDLGSVASGTLAIRTLGTGRVYIDGLGLSRI